MIVVAINLDDSQKKLVRADFNEAVNGLATQLDKWFQTNESRSVGQTKDGDSELVKHRSGHHSSNSLIKKVSDLSGSDCTHMSKVVSYVKRHTAQRPDQVTGSNWSYSSKSWGHDPEKK